MVIRTALMVCTSVIAISCTIEPTSGTLACKQDGDCPESLVCRVVAANDVKRCVGPRTPPWQPGTTSDAAAGPGADASDTPGDGTSDAGKDAAQTAPDAGTTDLRDAGSNTDPVVKDAGDSEVDSGIQVSGRVTVLQTVNAINASIQITEATIAIQPMLCGPPGAAADKRICVIGGIRP